GTKPKFRVIDMKLERMTGACYATEELLIDTTLLESVIMQGFSEEFGFVIDNEIVRGTGSGQMLGFLNSPCLVTVTKEANQADDTVVSQNIEKMWARLWSRSKGNAVWLINTSVGPQLMQLYHAVGTGGIPVYMPANGLSGLPYGTLFSRPVLEIEQASALGDVGDISLVDLSQYLYVDKGGVQAAQSIHVRFLYGENTFRFVLRNNGQPIWNSALAPFKGSDSVSPFVTLGAR
ncbi:MAG: phage major capsid protein, partial [Phycisphaerae bacterium]|nr:phage major capsid protein [Phycisphaerae bacterium]